MATVVTMNCKADLKALHARYGPLNNEQRDQIIKVMGGFDEILLQLLESNITIKQHKMHCIHRIIVDSNQSKTAIDKTKDNIEDNGYGKTLPFSFVDDDILLKHLFGKGHSIKIQNALSSTAVKLLSMLIWIILLIVYALTQTHILAWKYLLHCWSATCIIFSLYLVGWMMCSNTKALILLSKEFTFWFKLFYLLLYIISISLFRGIGQRDSNVIIWTFSAAVLEATFCFEVMIFDALNIKQTTKIFFSSIATGLFASTTLYLQHIALYPSQKHDTEFHSQFDSMTFTFAGHSIALDILGLAANSAQILTIFLLKQLISSIRKPTKATVIRVHPILMYEQKVQQNTDKCNQISMCQCKFIIAVAYIVTFILLALYLFNLNNLTSSVMFSIGLGLLLCAFCFFIFARDRLSVLCCANWLILCCIALYYVCGVLFQWNLEHFLILFILFAVSGMYAVMLKAGKDNQEKNEMNIVKETNQEIVKKSILIDGDKAVVVNVQIEDVQNETEWDNIGREESVPSILEGNACTFGGDINNES